MVKIGTHVTKSIEFAAGHRIPNHKSKCRNIHGHTYKVSVTVKGDPIETEGASDQGMVLDFGDLKNVMDEYIHQVFDHSFIVWEKDFEMLLALDTFLKQGMKIVKVNCIPTAENLSRLIWDSLETAGFTGLFAVTVEESPTSKAVYTGEQIAQSSTPIKTAGHRVFGGEEDKDGCNS